MTVPHWTGEGSISALGQVPKTIPAASARSAAMVTPYDSASVVLVPPAGATADAETTREPRPATAPYIATALIVFPSYDGGRWATGRKGSLVR